MKKTILSLSVILAACGGGGGGSSTSTLTAPAPTTSPTTAPTASPTAAPTSTPVPSPSAVGLWKGESTNKVSSAKRALTGLILADGSYYVWYSSTSNTNEIAGILLGQGSVTGSNLNWTGAKDFNLEGSGSILDATATSTAVTKTSLNGATTYTNSNNNSTFVSTYNKDFESTPSLATIAGTYSGKVSAAKPNTAVLNETANLTINSAGQISGTGQTSSCSISGTVTPRNDANAYRLSITFGPAPCLLANQTLTGVAYLDASQKRLYTVAPNTDRTGGVMFVGNK